MVKNILLIIAAIILGTMIGIVAVANSAEVRFENCEPGTWVGGVMWEWGEAGRGVYQGATYKDVPEIELKNVGALVVDLEPGDYAITHYRPHMSGRTEDGRVWVLPAKVLDFVEIEVKDEPMTLYFGCN